MSNHHALALYVVLERDWSDFIDMLREDETTDDTLQLLLKMLELKDNPHSTPTDHELNELGARCVHSEIKRRGIKP